MEHSARIITLRDIWNFLQTPIAQAVCCVLACLLAFNLGIQYARTQVEVHSITRYLAFIEIAGQEHMYELDWTEPEPIIWENH